ncbi:hypothetical protein K402DRAFT_400874 [Aulographum hederae CBS 113979]|uniref:F-box domain-containing protein n=1 Tax=Aulographum hederae CBS 113979 TaxID=1176131 RepID=A0A6G1HCP0_9PEZI|nr:hypothetical protein K402DRAFT_400874 [Aulographum hederae CBS 113979]
MASFHDLPSAVRREIYAAAGLFDQPNIAFTVRQRLDRERRNVYRTPSFDGTLYRFGKDRANVDAWRTSCSKALPPFLSLLLASREISREVLPIIFSTNNFSLEVFSVHKKKKVEFASEAFHKKLYETHIHLDGFALLNCLNNAAIASLQSISISLDLAILREVAKVDTRQAFKRRADSDTAVFSSTDSKAIEFQTLESWLQFARRFAAYNTDETCILNFSCKVADTEQALAAVQPILETLVLKHCSIRLQLSRTPFPDTLAERIRSGHMRRDLNRLARRCAVQSTGRRPCPDAKPFRFMDLPGELQLHILEMTDLNAPGGHMKWCPGTGFRFDKYLNDVTVDKVNRNADFTWRVDFCPAHGCYCHFCSTISGACSTRCRCWTQPIGLFLTSRQMRDDSWKTFCSSNRLVIVLWYELGVPDICPCFSHRMRRFFKQIHSDAIRSLRSLEIVFPPMVGDYMCVGDEDYQDWLHGIEVLRSQGNLSQLELAIRWVEPNSEGSGMICEERVARVRQIYRRVIKPVSALKGLKALYVLFEPLGKQDQLEPDVLTPYLDEKALESSVMGKEYDSYKSGKREYVCRKFEGYSTSWVPRTPLGISMECFPSTIDDIDQKEPEEPFSNLKNHSISTKFSLEKSL